MGEAGVVAGAASFYPPGQQEDLSGHGTVPLVQQGVDLELGGHLSHGHLYQQGAVPARTASHLGAVVGSRE